VLRPLQLSYLQLVMCPVGTSVGPELHKPAAQSARRAGVDQPADNVKFGACCMPALGSCLTPRARALPRPWSRLRGNFEQAPGPVPPAARGPGPSALCRLIP
jgi:hypothetical protein